MISTGELGRHVVLRQVGEAEACGRNESKDLSRIGGLG
jgi:hypothetical protein